MPRIRMMLIAGVLGLLLTVTAWTGGGSGRPAEAADQPIAATLISAITQAGTNCINVITTTICNPVLSPTAGLQVRQDIPDLRSLNFNDKTIAIRVTTPSAIAVYSDINFQGTCETFFGSRQIDLTNTMVGKNSISSVKVNATCDGPTTGKPVVTDLAAIDGGSSSLRCNNHFSRVNQDLNQSVGGSFIYLCVRYGPSNATSYISDARVIGPYLGATCCDPDGDPISASCEQPPDILLPEDLNNGVSGYPWVYICVSRVPNGTGNSRPPLHDLTAFSIKTANVIGADFNSYCSAALGVPSGSVDPENTNMNDQGVSFHIPPLSIFLCKSTYDGSAAATPAGTTTLPTMKAAAVNMPTNCGVFCVPQPVAPGSTVTKAGTVTVGFTCTDASGATLTPSNAKQTFNTNGTFTVTSTCTDGWGNQASASFTFTRQA